MMIHRKSLFIPMDISVRDIKNELIAIEANESYLNPGVHFQWNQEMLIAMLDRINLSKAQLTQNHVNILKQLEFLIRHSVSH